MKKLSWRNANPFEQKTLLLFLVAFCIRIIIIVSSYFIIGWPIGSSTENRIDLALNILNGNGFALNGFPVLYQTPVHPMFYAVVFLFAGYNWLSIGLSQALIDSFTCVIIAKLGNTFNSDKGIIAGYIYAFYPFANTQTAAIVDTSLLTFLFILSVYLLLNFRKTNRYIFLVLGGLFLGLGILDRPSIGFVVPAFIVLLFISRQYLKSFLIHSSLFIFLVSIIPLSWCVRNYILSGEFPVLSVAGNHYLWYSHNKHVLTIWERKESPDLVGKDPRYQMDPNFQVRDFYGIPAKQQVKLGKQASNIALNYIKNNPGDFIRYTLLKLERFLSWEYVVQNKLGREKYLWLRIWVQRFTSAPVVILGWLGLLLLFSRDKKIGIFVSIIVVGFIITFVLTQFVSRHKFPLDALFISLSPVSILFLKQKFLLVKYRIFKKDDDRKQT